jgi:hypothetical protein
MAVGDTARDRKKVARVAVSITPLFLEALSGAKLTANDDLGWRRELAAQANPCELVTPKNSAPASSRTSKGRQDSPRFAKPRRNASSIRGWDRCWGRLS